MSRITNIAISMVLINLMIVIIQGAIYDMENYNTGSDIDTEITKLLAIETDSTDEQAIMGTTQSDPSRQYESTVLNKLKIGYNMAAMILKGFNPLAINTNMYNTTLEKMIVRGIQLWRSIIISIVIIAATYNWFANKQD